MEENTALIRRMQRFLVREVEAGRPVDTEGLASYVGYSRRHCERLFRAATHKSVGEYVRLLRLTKAAKSLAEEAGSILDTALDSSYESHEGFTKAFVSAFGLPPAEYRKGGRAIPYFIPYPFSPHIPTQEDIAMNQKPVVTATYTQRPARQLLLLPSQNATDYFTFCEEQGCDWEGIMLSIPERLDTPGLVTLPPSMIPAGKASAAACIELPLEWKGEIPAGYQLMELPAATMLELRSQPYENEDEYCEAIEQVFAAYESYDPTPFGYRYLQEAPLFNFGAYADTGARISLPVERVK